MKSKTAKWDSRKWEAYRKARGIEIWDEEYNIERICWHLKRVWPNRSAKDIRAYAVAHCKANPRHILID
jgi:hypothetical protein